MGYGAVGAFKQERYNEMIYTHSCEWVVRFYVFIIIGSRLGATIIVCNSVIRPATGYRHIHVSSNFTGIRAFPPRRVPKSSSSLILCHLHPWLPLRRNGDLLSWYCRDSPFSSVPILGIFTVLIEALGLT